MPNNRTPADAAGSGTPSGPQPPSVAPGSSSSPVFDPFAITTPPGPSFGAVDTEWLAVHAADLSLGDDPGPTLPPTEYGIIINRSFTSPINAGAQVRGGAATDLGFLACPVAGPTSFIDSWGFPRSRGRSHKGADMFSPRHTPVVAVASGVITRVDRVDNYIVGTGRGDLGGKTLWLRDDAGHGYYYAHLEDISENIKPGVRVVQGQLLGTVGNSGNARTTPPHLHFQTHPHSGPAVNPYPYLQPACSQN